MHEGDNLRQLRDKRVLVVDSEPRIVESLAMCLKGAGIGTIRTACDGSSALRLHEEAPVDLILLDNFMPTLRGPEVLRELRRRGDRVTVIMHSAWNREELDLDGLELFAFMPKPYSLAAYMKTVRAALRSPTTRSAASAPDAHQPQLDGATTKKLFKPGNER